MHKITIETIQVSTQIQVNEALMRLMAIGNTKMEISKMLAIMLNQLPDKPVWKLAEGRIIKPDVGVN